MRLWHFRRVRRRRKPRKEQGTFRALLDFGASGARAGLVRLEDGFAHLLGVGGAPGSASVVRPGAVPRPDLLAGLAEQALSEAERQSAGIGLLPVIADEAVVGAGGPMLEAELSVWHQPRSSPGRLVSDEELGGALEALQRKALPVLAERATATKIRRRLIASQLVGVLADGQRLRPLASEPPGRKPGLPTAGLRGETLSLAVCNITWPLAGVEAVEAVLASLELSLAALVPLPQAVARVSPTSDAILIDVGQESSSIALAEGGVLSHARSFLLGGAHMTSAITRAMHLSPRAAELAKQRYAQGFGAAEARSEMRRMLAPALREWLAALEQALLLLAGKAPLPPAIFLSGGASTLPDLWEGLQGYHWLRRLPFERPPEVQRLVPSRIGVLRDPAGLLQGSAAVGVASLGGWAALERSSLDTLLAEISQRIAAEVGL